MLKKAFVVAVLASAMVGAVAGTAQADTTVPTIRWDSPNITGVKCVQIALNDHYGAGLDVDGDFGTLTQTYVETLQRDHHITVTGVVGPVTGQLIWNELKAHNDPHNCFHHIPTTSSTA